MATHALQVESWNVASTTMPIISSKLQRINNCMLQQQSGADGQKMILQKIKPQKKCQYLSLKPKLQGTTAFEQVSRHQLHCHHPTACKMESERPVNMLGQLTRLLVAAINADAHTHRDHISRPLTPSMGFGASDIQVQQAKTAA